MWNENYSMDKTRDPSSRQNQPIRSNLNGELNDLNGPIELIHLVLLEKWDQCFISN